MLRNAFLGSTALLLFAVNNAHAQSAVDHSSSVSADDLVALKAESERLRTLIPSQSHSMVDVSYHFTNLWFAGQHSNWPLAQFYLQQVRGHIKWALRIAPVRKTKAGELKLQEKFEPFDSEKLADIEKGIAAKDRRAFSAAYRETLSGCNDCHVASDKPYLRVVVPNQPEARGIDFSPQKEQR
jgi:hypothetical protein